jgi:hypothetical protein
VKTNIPRLAACSGRSSRSPSGSQASPLDPLVALTVEGNERKYETKKRQYSEHGTST